MSMFLKLHNTFARNSNTVQLAGKLISPTNHHNGSQTLHGSFYICGPTVYSDCHVGHAITYIRADMFRRFMRSLFNVRLLTVMNITDIDDKILDKAREETRTSGADQISSEPSSHPFNSVSQKYYKSFLADLESVRIIPADLYVRVSKHIHLITNFITKLERNGHAYVASNGDVYFDTKSMKNYEGFLGDTRGDGVDKSTLKRDPRDFVLWKAAKPGEPVWSYKSCKNDKCIPGRPGWHVQCSAISSSLFGNKLDFHWGGKDLIRPHHYNEEACCCAYHNLDTTSSLHVWSANWLHSGHLVFKNSKMSKSRGNVVAIKDIISRSSVNALRLLCVATHYRADIVYNEDMIEKVKALDHKINAFIGFLRHQLNSVQDNLPQLDDEINCENDIEGAILATNQDIVDGICDDFNLNRGLQSLLDLSKLVYSRGARSIRPQNLIKIWSLLHDWCETCGLEYGHLSKTSMNEETLLRLLTEFRQTVRTWALSEMKLPQDRVPDKGSLNSLLKECDSVRAKINEVGFVLRDPSQGFK